MCEHVKAMEEAFFASYNEHHDWRLAVQAANEAADEYHARQMPPDVAAEAEERARVEEQVLETMMEKGVEAGIAQYERRYVAELDAAHAQNAEWAYQLLKATHDAYHRHGQSKVRTLVEVANQFLGMALATGPEVPIAIMSGLLVDLVACSEAHAALVACREAVPAGLEDLKGE